MRPLLLALALARAAALLDSPGGQEHSPGLRGTPISEAEPAGQYSVRSNANVGCDQTKVNCFSGQVCSTTASTQQCFDATTFTDNFANAQKGPCNY